MEQLANEGSGAAFGAGTINAALSDEKDSKINDSSPSVNALGILDYLIPLWSPSARGESPSADYVEDFFLVWPPNLFAFTSVLFTQTGSYSRLTDIHVWDEQSRQDHRDRVSEIASEWKKNLNRMRFDFLISSNPARWIEHRDSVPDAVRTSWNVLRDVMAKLGVGDIQDMWGKDKGHLFISALELHAIVDETCVGWGIRLDEKISEQPRRAAQAATAILRNRGTLATIHPDRARILPKRHTPKVGLSRRSISSNLAFHQSSVVVDWETDGPKLIEQQSLQRLMKLSILLLPWPRVIRGVDFKAVEESPSVGISKNEDGLFTFAPTQTLGDELHSKLPKLIKEAEGEIGNIHLVVLPEGALRWEELDALEKHLGPNTAAYITGVRNGPSGEKDFAGQRKLEDGNFLCYGFRKKDNPEVWKRRPQRKHHRWRLDASQVTSYQLGGNLHPQYSWWENTPIGRRHASMINFGQELTICPLICEDLARQDPIADLIRSVGPSLVVALLLDGPQLKMRWSAKYASVLADDPGSSVLTLTSFGMVERHEVDGYDKSRVVALWSDHEGTRREIALERNAEAIVLSLAVNTINAVTLDGRREDKVGTFALTFGGTRQLSIGGESVGS